MIFPDMRRDRIAILLSLTLVLSAWPAGAQTFLPVGSLPAREGGIQAIGGSIVQPIAAPQGLEFSGSIGELPVLPALSEAPQAQSAPEALGFVAAPGTVEGLSAFAAELAKDRPAGGAAALGTFYDRHTGFHWKAKSDEELEQERATQAVDEPSSEDNSDSGKAEAANREAKPDKKKASALEEATQALFRLRQQVQMDGRKILGSQVGGDVGDGKLHRDVRRILNRLTKAAGLPPEAAQVFIGNSFLPNAFTLLSPSEGRYLNDNASVAKAFRVSNVFISLGLLRAAQNEHQLAFFLAHELNHNWKGHLKDFSGVSQVLGHFHELEADAEGLKLMAAAGYDPQAAVDGLYALDREMERIEKEYALLKQDRGEFAQVMRRLRDVHPHSDIRRANMLDHINEAKEAYKPAPVPVNPVWMERRLSAERPSHLDRFEKRLMVAVSAATSVEESLYAIEKFIEGASVKGGLGGDKAMEKYAIIEKAYTQLIGRQDASESLRPIDLSIDRESDSKFFPSHRLAAGLITRQLDLTIKRIGGRVTLEDFLKVVGTLSETTRRAGTLRILGYASNRRELDAALRTLSREAENLGLNIKAMKAAKMDHEEVERMVAAKLWRATRKVLTSEFGRPAMPEEIIDELTKKLSPSWLKNYRDGFNVEILESAFGVPQFRSKTLRPSQLAARLEGLSGFDQGKHWESSRHFSGLSAWSDKHYTPLMARPVNGKMVHRYERYYLKGLSSPSLADQLDMVAWFSNDSSLNPPFIKVLRQEGRLLPFLGAYQDALGRELKRRIKGAATLEERKAQLSWFNVQSSALLISSLFSLRDFKGIRETVEAIWDRIEALLASEELKGKYGKSNRSNMASWFFTSMGYPLRQAVVAADLSGGRPEPEEIRKTAALIRRIEKTLEHFPTSKLLEGHARNLAAHLDSDAGYMRAYRQALPSVVNNVGGKYGDWLSGFHSSKFARIVVFILKTVQRLAAWRTAPFEKGLAGIPDEDVRGLIPKDFVHFLGLIGSREMDPPTKLMAVALLDRIDMGKNAKGEDSLSDNKTGKDSFGRNIKMRAAACVGRWLLEDASYDAIAPADVRAVAYEMLRLDDLHPGLLQPDMETYGSIGNAFRGGAEFIKRNEAYRSLAKGEHPFRGVNTRWAVEMMRKLDRGGLWPKSFNERMDLLDFFNSTGEFSDSLDQRILDAAKADPKAFLDWVSHDQKRLLRFSPTYSLGELGQVETPFGKIPVPKAQPLKIVRNPNLRTQLFDLLPESKFAEKPPRRSWREGFRASVRLFKAYRAARKYLSREFLNGLRAEGSMEDRVFEVIEEVDRAAADLAQKAAQRWEDGKFTEAETIFLVESGAIRDPENDWKHKQPHEKEQMIKHYKDRLKSHMMVVLLELYNAFAGIQEPVLGLILDNYPEPTRSRDELIERLMKARRLSGAALSYLEGHKSYRQPNPVRTAEKHLLDQAVIQLHKFNPSEKVEILLHVAKVEPLAKAREKAFNARILSGDRKKLARDNAAIRSIGQLQDYMSLLHHKDRALIVRAMFYGKESLHQDPKAVQRLFERLVITGRDLPIFMEKVFRAYFSILTEDEKTKFISDLAAIEKMGPGMKGPDIVRVALKGMGVTGAKVAQVLATHKGLVTEEYAKILEEFKDKAQDMDKMRASGLMQSRMAKLFNGNENAADVLRALPVTALARAKAWFDRVILRSAVASRGVKPGAPAYTFDQLQAISLEALPPDNANAKVKDQLRRHLIKEVEFLLKEQGRRVRWIEEMGPELGAGSIKVVYKVTLDDGRLWVVKLRAPGAAYRTAREFEILDKLIAEMQARGDLDMPGAKQLLEEVKTLVQAEMNFNDERDKEAAMRERGLSRPWYARLLAPTPYIPNPHPLYVGEDLMIEEFVATTRFSDLPNWSLVGPNKRNISRLAVVEGMYDLLVNGWLEPDPHTGNRHARKGGWNRLWTRLVVMDLGQGKPQPIDDLKPAMKAGLALEAGDLAATAQAMLSMVQVPQKHGADKVLAAIEAGLNKRPEAGYIERMMDGLLESEKLGALVATKYAPLQKAFLIYTGYSQYMPKNYIFKALERAAMLRLVRDRPVSLAALAKLWLQRAFKGRPAVRAEMEALIETMADAKASGGGIISGK